MRYLFIITLLSIFIWGCSPKLYVFNEELYNKLKSLPNDSLLEITAFDSSKQVMHPDILYFDKKFYLSFTPYPFYNDSLENPCLFSSSNGLSFKPVNLKSNPLIKTPANYKKNRIHNDDPDISYNSKTNSIDLIYLLTMEPDSQNLQIIHTGDSNNLYPKTLIKYDLNKSEAFLLSPALCEYKKKQYLYYVNRKKNNKNSIEYLVSKKNCNFNKEKLLYPSINIPEDLSPWHIDIIKTRDKYIMLPNAYVGSIPVWGDTTVNKYRLYTAHSKDLKNWSELKELINCDELPDKQCFYVYRSSGIIEKDIFALWYSYVTKYHEWKIGFKKLSFTE